MASEKSFSLLSLLVLVLVVHSHINIKQCSAAASISKSPEAEALLKWKGSLFRSQALNSWSLNVSPCNWTGITCNGAKEKVVEINLRSCGLQGWENGSGESQSQLRFLLWRFASSVFSAPKQGNVPIDTSSFSSFSETAFLHTSCKRQLQECVYFTTGHKVHSGSPFNRMGRVIVAAIRKWRVTFPNDPNSFMNWTWSILPRSQSGQGSKGSVPGFLTKLL
ncbi:hypothetical protein MRB53_035566 [Persea americana]|uniref:Uncharacterized protein n=1 Tax=Persea americana TaxID=3435 RepID=A0ACC2K4Z1_PERAE|nr:hypothetical protein MRB53_035566 [Persea americana]